MSYSANFQFNSKESHSTVLWKYFIPTNTIQLTVTVFVSTLAAGSKHASHMHSSFSKERLSLSMQYIIEVYSILYKHRYIYIYIYA